MKERQDQGKTDIRTKTSWDEVNDTRGKTEIKDPNKGPKHKRK
ncbi:hypothetical protein [Ammoniphilus sp. CFH 90114]|nr:hypothetical protein [Ammoniphilus sp. CFH 90114]